MSGKAVLGIPVGVVAMAVVGLWLSMAGVPNETDVVVTVGHAVVSELPDNSPFRATAQGLFNVVGFLEIVGVVVAIVGVAAWLMQRAG